MQNNIDYSAERSESGSGQARWQDDTILLVMTYSKLHRYIPAIRENLDLFWPDRPQTVYASDAPLEGDDVILQEGDSFLDVLEGSIDQIDALYPAAKYVFVLLEDICPLGPVDEAKLARAQTMLREKSCKHLNHHWRNKKAFCFKYFCIDDPVHLLDGDIDIRSMPRWQTFHNAIPASFWEIDHLRDIVDQKRALGHVDPWSFELPVQPVCEDHFIWDAIWPTVPDGFLTQGAINSKAITRNGFPPSPLRTQLRREYCGYDSRIMSVLKRTQLRLKSEPKDPKAAKVEQLRTSQHSA